MDVYNGIVKGDSINLESDLNTNITNWKIRCELYDECGRCIKLATANSGGSTSQIDVTDATNGLFLIQVAKGLTKDFEDKGFIEIEAETDTGEIHTVKQAELRFLKQKIDWTDPSA